MINNIVLFNWSSASTSTPWASSELNSLETKPKGELQHLNENESLTRVNTKINVGYLLYYVSFYLIWKFEFPTSDMSNGETHQSFCLAFAWSPFGTGLLLLCAAVFEFFGRWILVTELQEENNIQFNFFGRGGLPKSPRA